MHIKFVTLNLKHQLKHLENHANKHTNMLPDLQNLSWKLAGALADHNLMVFTALLPYPGIGLS